MNNVIARAELLIHKTPEVVFDAFVNPSTIEKFWLKSTSGPLIKGAIVNWEFMVQGAYETVTVTEFIENQTIGFTWSDDIAVKFEFHRQGSNGTKVSVSATGFEGTEKETKAVNATEGFAIVLCDLKCLLETGQSGNMVRDKAALISASNNNA